MLENIMLGKAIVIAKIKHKEQFDKGGQPYIYHPLRVMLNLTDENDMICAVLHDVIEDTDTTLDDLRQEGFSEEIITALDCLTRRENESYMQYINRIKTNDIAKRVKLKDLEDNMQLSRIKNPTQKDYDRVKKYEKAKKVLLEK